MQPLWNLFGMTPFEGAKTQLYLAGSPEVEEKNYRCVRSRQKFLGLTDLSTHHCWSFTCEQRHVLCPDRDSRLTHRLRARQRARRAALETVRGHCRASLIRSRRPASSRLCHALVNISVQLLFSNLSTVSKRSKEGERGGVYCLIVRQKMHPSTDTVLIRGCRKATELRLRQNRPVRS